MRTLLLCLLLALTAYTASAQYGSGFSVVSGQTLWEYGDYSSLFMFFAHVESLPVSAAPVSAAVGVNDAGGFVVACADALYGFDKNTWAATGFTGRRITDVAFVPDLNPNGTFVAFGLELGALANTAVALRSVDGGKTWSDNIALGSTEATGSGSVSFGFDLGVAAIGGRIYRTTDGGKTWSVAYTSYTTITKVAVYNSSLALATGPGTFSLVSLISTDAGNTWNDLSIPTFSPSGAVVSGIVLVDAETWVLTTSGGQIWRRDSAGWNPTFTATNISWADVSYLPSWNCLVAVGSYPLKDRVGVVALSYDQGKSWETSSPQPSAAFVRVVAGVPVNPQAPTPSPSPSPSHSPSPSVTPSISPSASVTPSSSPSPSPSPSRGASASPSPSRSASPSPTASSSVSPSHSASPSTTASPSVSPSVSRTPSASPSKGSSPSRTPSPSPSHTPSPSPSKGSSTSPSPSPAKKKDDNGVNKKLALGLGLGLGLGGLAALIGGAGLFWYIKQKRARTNTYQPINVTDV